jgi:hypothetical protein
MTETTALWIEYTDESGEDGASRWGSATNAQIDKILAYTVTVLGEPDSIV